MPGLRQDDPGLVEGLRRVFGAALGEQPRAGRDVAGTAVGAKAGAGAVSFSRDLAVRELLLTLDDDEAVYARDYAEHLMVGAREPGLGAVELERAAMIRAALRSDWDRRVWGGRRRRKGVAGKV